MNESVHDPASSPRIVRAAVVQAAGPLFDSPLALARAEALIREAVTGRGAAIVVLPEAFIGGYPKGLDFGITVGSRTPAGRDLFRRYHAAAIEVPGPEVDTLAGLTRELGCHAVIGAVERRGGTLYCVALFFGPDGYLGLHRKLMPTAAERYLWGQGDGSTLMVVDTGLAKIGAAICWENRMPLFRATMYAKGVDVWCAPTVDDRDSWQATMRHIAVEGRCFVLSAAPFMRRDAMPTDLHPVQGDDPDTVLIGGGSVIVSPLGEILAGPLRDAEGIVVADLDLDDLARARFDFDPVGHYARSDVFTLNVDETSRSSVVPTHVP
jgi:nitrilase